MSNGVIVREFCKLGNNISVGNNSIILPYVCLENNVKIHTLAEIAEYTLIREGLRIGPGVKVYGQYVISKTI